MPPVHTLESVALAAGDAYEGAHMEGATEFDFCGQWACSRCGHSSAVDVFARLIIRDGVALLAFRGTDSAIDWLSNVSLHRCQRWTGAAHGGFAHCWDAIAERVAEQLQAQPLAAITVTGHSLGGAVATVAALDLADLLPGVTIDLTTFGAPRCLDDRLLDRIAGCMEINATRYVNGPDPVTWLPPYAGGYRHPGPATQLRLRASMLAVGNWFAGKLLSREYHPMRAYWTALQPRLKEATR